MDIKPSYFGILPAPVRYCKNLEPGARVLYSEITALANERGYCWASNDYFARLYDITPKTVSSWVSSLEKEGFVIVDVNQKRTDKRHIYISIDAALRDGIDVSGCTLMQKLPNMNGGSSTQKCVETSTQKCAEVLHKNVMHNNRVEYSSPSKEVEEVTASAATDAAASLPAKADREKKRKSATQPLHFFSESVLSGPNAVALLRAHFSEASDGKWKYVDFQHYVKSAEHYYNVVGPNSKSASKLKFRNWYQVLEGWFRRDSDSGKLRTLTPQPPLPPAPLTPTMGWCPAPR